MSMQTKILVEERNGGQVPYVNPPASGTENIIGGIGILSSGKPGDIVESSYGPVAQSYVNKWGEMPFGTFKAGMGILVNPNDSAAVGPKFETVYGIKSGQVGTFLRAGACVVKCSEVPLIKEKMRVEYLWGYSESAGSDEICIISVNGFDAFETPPPSKEEAKEALKDINIDAVPVEEVEVALADKGFLVKFKSLKDMKSYFEAPDDADTERKVLEYVKG